MQIKVKPQETEMPCNGDNDRDQKNGQKDNVNWSLISRQNISKVVDSLVGLNNLL